MPGLQSLASAIETPARPQPGGVGIGRPGAELHAGQQRGDGVARRVGQGVDVGSAQVGAVVDAGRAELDREPHARARTQLVAVHAQPEPGRPTGLQHGTRLVLGEGVGGVRLAEHVDPAGVRRGGRQHRAGDQIDVAGPVVPPLRRHDVGPEQRGLGGDLAGDPQQPGLVVDGEPVAALDLHGGGARPPAARPSGRPAGRGARRRSPPGWRPPWWRSRRRRRAPRSSGRRTRPRGHRRRPGGCARRRSRAARCGRRRRPPRRRAAPRSAARPRRSGRRRRPRPRRSGSPAGRRRCRRR